MAKVKSISKKSKKSISKVKPNTANGMGVSSLVLGIISLFLTVLGIPIIGIILGILGIIFSKKQKKIFPNGIQQAGYITSIVSLVISSIYSVFIILIILISVLFIK